MSTAKKPKVISLFAGCGGSSLGYKLAGFDVLAAIEFDKNAVETYAANHLKTKIYSQDIQQLDPLAVAQDVALKVGELDVLDGSPPCQGFSTAGKRKSGDSRNELYLDYIRFVKGLQPRVFVMENVSGMIKGHMKLKFKEILTRLKGLGYQVGVQVLNAKHYGVPQSRERLIFIGVRGDLNMMPTFPVGSSKVVPLKQALKFVKREPSQMLKDKELKLWEHTRPGHLLSEGHQILYGRKSYFTSLRLSWDRPANTLCKTMGVYGHPDEPRNLTIAEIKRIASFPDDYKFVGTFTEKWARIGNSVPPLLMRSIAAHIKNEILKSAGARSKVA